jgi:hypothetical protein
MINYIFETIANKKIIGPLTGLDILLAGSLIIGLFGLNVANENNSGQIVGLVFVWLGGVVLYAYSISFSRMVDRIAKGGAPRVYVVKPYQVYTFFALNFIALMVGWKEMGAVDEIMGDHQALIGFVFVANVALSVVTIFLSHTFAQTKLYDDQRKLGLFGGGKKGG